MAIKTLVEVAQEKGLQPGTLRNSYLQGRLPAIKSAGTLLIDLDDPQVQDYFKNFQARSTVSVKGTCLVCGKNVTRARAKYCGRECWSKRKANS